MPKHESITDWNSNPIVSKTVQPNLSRAHRITNFRSTNWMHAPYASSTIFSPEDQMLIEITTLHPREIQICSLHCQFSRA